MSRPVASIPDALRQAAADEAEMASQSFLDEISDAEDEDANFQEEDAEINVYREAYITFLLRKNISREVATRYAHVDFRMRNSDIDGLIGELKAKDGDALRGYLSILTGNQIRMVLRGCAAVTRLQRGPDPGKVALSQRIAAILEAPAAAAPAAAAAVAAPPRFTRQAQIAQLCSVAADLSPHALVVELKRLLADAEADLPSSKKARQE